MIHVCKRNHPLTAENVSIQKSGEGREFKVCRQCNMDRAKAWRAANREHIRQYRQERRRVAA